MKVPLHSTNDASRLAALLLRQIFPIFSVVAPCQPGASSVSVRRGTSTTGSQPPPERVTSMKRFLLALFIAAAAASAAGCRDQNAAAATPVTPPTVSVITVAPERVAITGEWIATLDGIVNAQIRPQVSGYLIAPRPIGKAPSSARASCCSRSIAGRSRRPCARPRRGSPRPTRSSRRAERDLARDRPLAEQRAIAQSQLDNDISARDAAQAALASAKAAVESAELNLALHPRHLAHRRRRRHRQRADRRSGRPDDAAHDRLAGGSDQGLLPDQRTGVPRASPAPFAPPAAPPEAVAGRAAAWRWCSPTAARIRASGTVARRRSRGRPEDGHHPPQRDVPEPRQRASSRASSGASGRRSASRSRRCWCRSARSRSSRTATSCRIVKADNTVAMRTVDARARASARAGSSKSGLQAGDRVIVDAPALRSGTTGRGACRRSRAGRRAAAPRRPDVPLLHPPPDRRDRHRDRHRARRAGRAGRACRSRSSRRSSRRRSP